MARIRVNDAIASIGGEILTTSAPFSQTLVNAAWRVCQEFLANLGYKTLIDETLLANAPAVTSIDPAVQTWVDWGYYYDGQSLQTTPVLPQNFASPLKMWERPTGSNMPFSLHPNMENVLDGYESRPKTSRNRFWEWRGNKIVMPGSLQPMDLKIRFISYLSDFQTVGNPAQPGQGTWWYDQPIPIPRVISPLSKLMAYELCQGRGDVDAGTFKSEAEAELKMVFNRDVRAGQRVNYRRQGRSGRMGGQSGYGYGY